VFGLGLDADDDTVVGSIIDGNRVTRDFPDETMAPLLDWALVKVKGGIGVGTEICNRRVGVAKWVEPGRLRSGVLLPGAIWLLGGTSWAGLGKLSVSRGTGILRRGAEPGVLRRGTGLMGVAEWVELRRETGGTGLVDPGILSRGAGRLLVFTLAARVGVAT
jgi:hypothetical protein